MIIDQQNSERPAFWQRRGEFHNPRRRRNGLHRQYESGTAIASFAARDESSAMRLRERFRNRQTETETTVAPLKCALALLERVKNPIHDFRVDSNSGIVHGNCEQLRLRIGR